MSIRRFIFALKGLCVAVALSTVVRAHELHLQIADAQETSGLAHVQLYYSAQPFSTENNRWKASNVAVKQQVELNQGIGRVQFDALPSGWYAIRLFVDENGNGQLDYSTTGLPQEAVGFSTNPALFRGAPQPADVAFELSADSDIAIAVVRSRKRRR